MLFWSHFFLWYAKHGIHLGGESPLWGVHRNRQPLAKVKGVHREVESEGRQRQNSGLRNTNHIRHIMGMSVPNNTKSKRVADKTVICKCGRYMEGKRYDLILGGLAEEKKT